MVSASGLGKRACVLGLWLILGSVVYGAAAEGAARVARAFTPGERPARVVFHVRGAFTLGGYELNLAVSQAGRPVCVSVEAKGEG